MGALLVSGTAAAAPDKRGSSAARSPFCSPADVPFGFVDLVGNTALDQPRARSSGCEGRGLQAATDGEFRRRSWWLDLIMGWEGFSANRTGTTEMVWRKEDGSTQPFSRLWVNGPIRWRPSATVRAFEFLKANTDLVPKVTLPAPILVHMYSCGNQGVLEGHYRDLESFWSDVVAAYRQVIDTLVRAGATYIQFDDTSIAFLPVAIPTSMKMREHSGKRLPYTVWNR